MPSLAPHPSLAPSPARPAPQFLSVLMKPNPKSLAKLRKVMEQTYKGVGSHHFSTEGAGGEDLYPYVSFTLNIDTA